MKRGALPGRERAEGSRSRGLRGWRPGGLRLPVLTLVALVLAGAGCGLPDLELVGDPDIGIAVGVSPTPPMVGPATVRVEVIDLGAPLPEGSTVRARLLGEQADSVYRALELRSDGAWSGPLDFPEAGDARIEVVVERPDGTGATLRLPVTVSARPVR